MMPRKYLAFDLETASESMRNLSSRRGLGITCAAVLAEDSTDPVVWYAGEDSESPTDQMDSSEAQRVVEQLQEYVDSGYTLLTWNGHGFDFKVLAEESGLRDACWDLSLNHIDMMFHVVCEKGFRVSLAAASQAAGVGTKHQGMSGQDAPKFWKEGEHSKVMDYLRRDVELTLKVAQEADRRRRFNWMTQRGKTGKMDLPQGWLSVAEAWRLPQPDTSWMDDPRPRIDFYDWTRI
jgi:hypothetical protein